MAGMLGSVFEREEIAEADIEKLKQADLLESAFSEFASRLRTALSFAHRRAR